jgi:hypothetical protein
MDVLAEVGPEQRERAGGEARLHDRLFVREVQHDRVVREPRRGLRAVGGDDSGRRGKRAQQVDHLRSRSGAGDRHDPVVPAASGELRGLERVGLALAGPLAQRRVRLAHEPRRPATDDRDPFTGGRQGRRFRELGGLDPAVGLAGDLGLDVGHRCSFSGPRAFCAVARATRQIRAPFCVDGCRGRNRLAAFAQPCALLSGLSRTNVHSLIT